MSLKTMDQFDPYDKKILCRVDINVPLGPDGVPTDISRIQRVAPTLKELSQRGGRLILLAHLGRPDGHPNPDYSLRGLCSVLEDVLRHPVTFIPDLLSPEAEEAVNDLQAGDVALGENIRFYPGEESNDPSFVEALARLGEVYVNEAFSASHRAHASIVGIAQKRPAFAGRLMAQELEALESGLTHPEHPLLAIVGGAKVSTKLALLSHLIEKVDQLMVGGGMANTFLLARGFSIGSSLCEPSMVGAAQEILKKAQERGVLILLPTDVMVRDQRGVPRVRPLTEVEDGDNILDVGPHTRQEIPRILEGCRTVTWNGPLGLFEEAPFHEGTMALARAVAERTQADLLVSVAGGGDTVAALHQAGCDEDLTYVSTAGGAFLEWLEGQTLPGLVPLYES